MVQLPTDSFHLEIIVPNMIYEGKRRILSSNGGWSTHKRYLGTQKDITFRKQFRYNEINEVIEALKSHIMEYYQNPASKAYGPF